MCGNLYWCSSMLTVIVGAKTFKVVVLCQCCDFRYPDVVVIL